MNKYVEDNPVGSFTFAGKNTYKDFGLVVQTVPNYEVAAREQTSTKIIGRNGDIVDVTGSFLNVTRSYSLVLYYENNDNMDYVKNAYYDDDHIGYDIHKTVAKNSTFIEKAREIVSWLKSVKGYSFLIDTYDPKVYRKAVLKSADVVTNIYDQAFAINVEFTCRPERYEYNGIIPVDDIGFSLYSGNPTSGIISKGVTVTNTYDTDAYPIVCVKMGSSRNVNYRLGADYPVCSFTLPDDIDIPSYIVMDYEKKYTYAIYENSELTYINFNKYVPILFRYTPVKGENLISSGDSDISIIYNWWCL